MSYSKTIAGTVAYMVGVYEPSWELIYSDGCGTTLKKLEQDQNAKTIRCLCKLRTELMFNFKRTDAELIHEIKNIDRMRWFDADDVKWLEKNGVHVLLANKKAADYALHINDLIDKNIDKCQPLFPDWVNWKYIRGLFVINNFRGKNVLRDEFSKFMDNLKLYPYQKYIFWEPVSCSNLLANDIKFLDILYKQNHDEFTDRAKCKIADGKVIDGIYGFIDKGRKIDIVVDCENSSSYKLYSVIKALDEQETAKIHKIILYDDATTIGAWDFLEKVIKIPIEHVQVQRIVGHKSLVDVRMTAGVCQEFFAESVSSFIIFSSDSDYWALISSLPDADFLVALEPSKSGEAIIENLDKNNIAYCSIDDFGNGNIEDLKKIALLKELNDSLSDLEKCNGKELARTVFEKTRIRASDGEIMNFYDKYIKTIRLQVDRDGNFKYVVNT